MDSHVQQFEERISSLLYHQSIAEAARGELLNGHQEIDAPPDSPLEPVATSSEAWTVPDLDRAAYHGLAGEVVDLFTPHTEAHPVALLVSFLAEVGALIGRGPHLTIDGAYHPLLFWPVLVGQSSKSRKGTAGKRIHNLISRAVPDWTRGAYKGNLSSGEGLVFAVRDPEYKEEVIKEKGRPTGETISLLVDKGVLDKRLFLVQSEFGSVLRVMSRDGNSLSGVLREAWDGEDLAPMTKGSRIRATAPHIGIVGHVTRDELLRDPKPGTDLAIALSGLPPSALRRYTPSPQVLTNPRYKSSPTRSAGPWGAYRVSGASISTTLPARRGLRRIRPCRVSGRAWLVPFSAERKPMSLAWRHSTRYWMESHRLPCRTWKPRSRSGSTRNAQQLWSSAMPRAMPWRTRSSKPWRRPPRDWTIHRLAPAFIETSVRGA